MKVLSFLLEGYFFKMKKERKNRPLYRCMWRIFSLANLLINTFVNHFTLSY